MVLRRVITGPGWYQRGAFNGTIGQLFPNQFIIRCIQIIRQVQGLLLNSGNCLRWSNKLAFGCASRPRRSANDQHTSFASRGMLEIYSMQIGKST